MNVKSQEIYSEVYSVLQLLGNDYISKLPKSLFKMIEEEKSNTYNPKYSYSKSLSEQNIKKESLSMIALFHLNYWCKSKEEKENLKKLFKENEKKYQEELKERYNPDNIFHNRKSKEIDTKTEEKETQLVEYKETFWGKFTKFIKKILHIK